MILNRHTPQPGNFDHLKQVRLSREGYFSFYDFGGGETLQYNTGNTIEGVLFDFANVLFDYDNNRKQVILSTGAYIDPEKNVVYDYQSKTERTPREFMLMNPGASEHVVLYVFDTHKKELIEVNCSNSKYVIEYLNKMDSFSFDGPLGYRGVKITIVQDRKRTIVDICDNMEVVATMTNKEEVDKAKAELDGYLSTKIKQADTETMVSGKAEWQNHGATKTPFDSAPTPPSNSPPVGQYKNQQPTINPDDVPF